jgi:hypothetical protein
MPLAEMQRLNWTTTENESSHWNTIAQSSVRDTKINLNPMEIRTFHVTVQ